MVIYNVCIRPYIVFCIRARGDMIETCKIPVGIDRMTNSSELVILATHCEGTI